MRTLLFVIILTVPVFGVSALPFDGLLRAFRTDAGLVLPRVDEALAETCSQRADVLAASGELSHTDEQGRSPGVQAMTAGLPPGEYGEVLGSGPNEAEVWKAWLASPAHLAVLAEPGWVTWGVGIAIRGNITIYVVRFWKP